MSVYPFYTGHNKRSLRDDSVGVVLCHSDPIYRDCEAIRILVACWYRKRSLQDDIVKTDLDVCFCHSERILLPAGTIKDPFGMTVDSEYLFLK